MGNDSWVTGRIAGAGDSMADNSVDVMSGSKELALIVETAGTRA